MYYCDDRIPLSNYQGISDNRKNQTKNSTFDDNDDISESSAKKESFLHTMGPLTQDFLFLKKLAFSPDIAANMLGKVD